jgi:Immunity protein 35
MIDRETAKSLVLRYLSTLPPKDGSGWDVEDEKTTELDDVWMFCWTLKSLIERGGKRPGMVGNYPILVDKADGSLYAWTMLEPLERLLEKLRHDKTVLPRLNPEGG